MTQKNLSDSEKYKLLVEFNNTKTEYPKERTICSLFEEQVEKTPDKIAVVFGNKALTYRELSRKSNQVAQMLRESGVEKGTIVGLMLRRSLEMVIGIIAVLKSKAVCLPVDIKYPDERICMILEDSGTQILLGMDHTYCLPGYNGKILDVGCCLSSSWDNFDGKLDLYEMNSEELAYIVYTSGSTGKPKGVMLKHSGINNHTYTKIKVLGLCQDDIMCHNLSISFVASIWQIFAPLFIGATLAIYPENIVNNPYALFKSAARDNISVLEVVPSLLNSYLELLDEGKISIDLPKLKVMALTGERITPALINKFYRRYKTRLVNAYGQSECSDDTLHYDIPYDTNTSVVPIGKPSNNTSVYILDRDMCLQPVGEAGELYISGDGLAQGYLNRPELTAEKFIPNPFYNHQLMYRTGDIARWLSNGNVEFIGRVDQQVKIRGYRIELGEVEAHLLSNKCVKEVVVVDQEDSKGDKFLCAYVVLHEGMSPAELRDALLKVLPDYMVPAYIIRLEKIPLTPNGKVDRNALLNIGSTCEALEKKLPESEIELKLAVICKKVFDTKEIGLDENFFELGGHSLKFGLVSFGIYKEFKVELSMDKIFRSPTIRGLAKCISDSAGSIYPPIEPVDVHQVYSASSAQKRMYVLDLMNNAQTSYNTPVIMVIEGRLDKKRFEEAFKALIKRHEALRTSFRVLDGETVQVIEPQDIADSDPCFGISFIKSNEAEVDNIIKEFIRPFDLSRIPLLRSGVIELSEIKHILVLDIHHIISDGTSENIMVWDLFKLYEEGKVLPELRIQYKDFAAWQNRLLQTEAIKRQEEHWLSVYSGDIPLLNMPTDYPRPDIRTSKGNGIAFELNKKLTNSLALLTQKTETTLYMVLLTAYNILLYKYSGQEDIIVGSPIAGRPHADLENVIGIFVNTLAMRNFPSGNKTFNEFLKEVGENTLRAYENQDYQFELLVNKLKIERDIGRNPLFDTCFTIINRENSGLYMFDSLKIKPYRFKTQTVVFDLLVTVLEHSDELSVEIDYLAALFKQSTVDTIGKNYLEVLCQIAENNDIKLKDITISYNLLKASTTDVDKGDFDF